MGPIRRLISLSIPPCSTCVHYAAPLWGQEQQCRCPGYLDYLERKECRTYRSADCTLVRGTRHCTYERRKDEDERP